ncbi:Mrp/NBP35 family ATP-binding protein [Thermotoga caldifontis]|uniref:Mrp/NBP35 family ATP-binding protein n=1 Tax=Thermotoga caldifontis TaxID=1508419 RepID=UPI0005973176|nr:Mrp/NBP35 family ATP-binding protein [Thermotoga caldifontis]
MARIRHKIAILSGKGGVGKTTVAVNVAVALAEEGFKVALLDLDLHGPNIPRMLGIEESPSVQEGMIVPVKYGPNMVVLSIGMLVDRDRAVAWRGPLKHSAIQQFLSDTVWGEQDFMIFDLPPGTGDEALSLMQLVELDGVVLVTTPQRVALDDVTRAVHFTEEMGQRVLGFVNNMAYTICPHCGGRIDIFGRDSSSVLSELLGLECLATIPLEPKLAEFLDVGKNAIMHMRGSEVEKAFRQLVASLITKLGGEGK